MLRSEIIELRSKSRITQTQLKTSNAAMDSLEYKVNIEKNKKEIETLRKNERTLLIEKTQLDSKYKQMQEELIKVKGNSAAMLNAVYEYADQEVAEQIIKCIE